ncbi:hypothetical protein J1614_001053 [Plenodomus biglobosus]|nr:hypothetical protein J1614_001053 [Plenodomus biglobosus]
MAKQPSVLYTKVELDFALERVQMLLCVEDYAFAYMSLDLLGEKRKSVCLRVDAIPNCPISGCLSRNQTAPVHNRSKQHISNNHINSSTHNKHAGCDATSSSNLIAHYFHVTAYVISAQPALRRLIREDLASTGHVPC